MSAMGRSCQQCKLLAGSYPTQRCHLDGQGVTTLSAAGAQDRTPSLRRHAGTETVGALTLTLVGLVSPLHCVLVSIRRLTGSYGPPRLTR